jgi:hypothetical protein
LVLDNNLLEVEPGIVPSRLNDVELGGRAVLNAGDVLVQRELTYLVMIGPSATPRRRWALEHRTFLSRVEDETRDADTQFGLMVGQSGAFVSEALDSVFVQLDFRAGEKRPILGRVGSDLLEVLIPGVGPDESERVRLRIAAAVEEIGETVRWGLVQFPRDGATGEELWANALSRVLGLETVSAADVPWFDAVTASLWALRERWAHGSRPLAIVGEDGSGRETFARGIRTVGARETPFVVYRGAKFDAVRWAEDIKRAEGGALHVRHPEILPERVRSAFFVATSFIPSGNFSIARPMPADVATKIFLPALRDRPADVLPIAEYVLHTVDERLARRRSSLRADAKAYLTALDTPENSRSLRNAVLVAALSLDGLEMRAEHLGTETGMRTNAVSGVREQLEATERHAIHEALRRTNWNVSEAARAMALPRRTLVYRMNRLGLRRPKSRT